MATLEPCKPSFFDDEDSTIKFNWQDITTTIVIDSEPLAQGSFNLQSESKPSVLKCFTLFQHRIIQSKDQTTKQAEVFLDITHSRLKLLPNGFTLVKNEMSYDFISNDDFLVKSWIDQLRKLCVLTTFHEDYRGIKFIGKGGFASVILAESVTTGKSVAVKGFNKRNIFNTHKKDAKPMMLNEIEIMRSISHENIIQLYEVYESDNSIYLVLELIQGKTLQFALEDPFFQEKYSETKVVAMIRSILDALAYLAAKGIMHRDLKPDNILLDKDGNVKIVDFGLASFIDLESYIFERCGTAGYMAPEIFRYDKKKASTHYDDRCDVFSAGCIMFYMLFGYPFLEGSDKSETLIINRMFTNKFVSITTIKHEIKDSSSKISKEGLKLLLELIEFDHKRRKRARDVLRHPYFASYPNTHKISMTDNDPSYSDSPKLSAFYNRDCPRPVIISNSRLTAPPKQKYEQKDLFYMDVGQPLLNGRTSTLCSGINSSINSSLSGQLSNKRDQLRKAAIMRKFYILDNDGESLIENREKSNSISDNSSFNSSLRVRSLDDSEDVPNEDSQVKKHIDKLSSQTPEKHQSPLLSKRNCSPCLRKVFPTILFKAA